MSRELSLYEAMGGTYTEVNGILYPNISVEAKEPNTDSAITSTNIGKYGHLWISYELATDTSNAMDSATKDMLGSLFDMDDE